MINSTKFNGYSVTNLDFSRYGEVKELLTTTFQDYVSVKHFFGKEGEKKLRCLRLYFNGVLKMQAEKRQPVLGAIASNQIVGVAIVNEPGISLSAWVLIPLILETGLPRIWRLVRTIMAVEPYKPAAPYYYLQTLGVHPDFQAQGYGRALLDAVHALSKAHPTSTGVWLETTDPNNVPMYEHFGYKLKEKLNVQGLEVNLLFRPNQ